MGVEFALVDTKKKEYILLGKRCSNSQEGEFFQMPELRIVNFLASRELGTPLILTTDSSEEIDIHSDEYRRLDKR